MKTICCSVTRHKNKLQNTACAVFFLYNRTGAKSCLYNIFLSCFVDLLNTIPGLVLCLLSVQPWIFICLVIMHPRFKLISFFV